VNDTLQWSDDLEAIVARDSPEWKYEGLAVDLTIVFESADGSLQHILYLTNPTTERVGRLTLVEDDLAMFDVTGLPTEHLYFRNLPQLERTVIRLANSVIVGDQEVVAK
jgi:hypothetical protein